MNVTIRHYTNYIIVNLLLLLRVYNDIMKKSHEQKLITKMHAELCTYVVMYVNIIIVLLICIQL